MRKEYMIVLLLFICLCYMECGDTNTSKIVSLNIRYENNNDGNNNWNKRKNLVSIFLNKEHPDIICLQEVLASQLAYLQNELSGYNFVGCGREDGETKGEYVPIFFDTTKYALLESGQFWLSESPEEKGSIGWDAKSPRILTWASLENKNSKKKIYILNTHLDNRGKVARVESAKLLLNWVSKHISEYCPIILAGDLNSTFNSETYRLIVDKLSDSYFIANHKKGVDYSFHKFGNIPKEKRTKIDYVFVSKNIHVNAVNIQEDVADSCFMLSDHNPIVVELSL